MRKLKGAEYKESSFDVYQQKQYKRLMHQSLALIENFWLKPNAQAPRLSLIQS
jgi:hypothetical protein